LQDDEQVRILASVMPELTNSEIERQDFVDNAVYHLIVLLNPSSVEIPWDIEMIASVRERVRDWVVENRRICTEQEFYPYVENGNPRISG
jgi:hypothetical protein